MNRVKENSERRNTYRDELVTIGDLEDFKMKLLEDLKIILKEMRGEVGKKWMKSNEVRKMLGVSPGTLQNMRINGTLPSTKIGGIVFYDYEDIQRMLQENKQ
jgi:Helix-turn-helix domain